MGRAFRRAVLAGVLTLMVGAAPAAEDIAIGVSGPVTGPIAFLGQHMKWGAELAAEAINARGGALGRKLRFSMQDSACRPADAVSVAERLINQDQVPLMFGDLCSGATLAMMPIVERAGIPMLVSISTHPDITAKAGVGGNPWVFRTVPNDMMLAQVIAKELGAAAYRTIAFLAEDTDYGRGAVALLKMKLGPDLKIISEDYVKNSETDFLQVLTRLRSAKPDALGIYMLDQQGFNFMKQYVQFGMSTPLVARPPLVSALVADLLATGKFNGSWTVYPYYDAYDSAANRAFVEPFRKLHDQGPHYVAFGMYEGFMIAADAIARAGSTEPAKLRDALKATRYEGILGKVEFDAHDQAHNSLMFLKVNDGKLRVQDLVRG